MRALLVVSLFGCTSTAPTDTPPISHPHRLSLGPALDDVPAIAAPVSEPQPVDVSFVDGTELRPPVQLDRLTLIPIVATTPSTARFITLQDGMASGLVSVIDNQGVHQLTVSNRSPDTLVILGGEILVDGHQDRIVARDMLVDAGRTRTISAFCIERGRSDGGDYFHPSHALAEDSLRRFVVDAHGDPWDRQVEVWDRVDAINAREGLAPTTSTYRFAARRLVTGTGYERRGQVISKLDAVRDSAQIVGVAVAIDDHVVRIDRFATPALYRKLQPMLMSSYLPASRGKAQPADHPVSFDDVRAFAETINEGVRRPRRNREAVETSALRDRR